MVSFETVCDKVETCQYSVEISVEYLSQSRPMPRSTGVRGGQQVAFINGPQVEPFMERVTRTGNEAEWTTGGYGYFSVTGLGAGRITDLRYQDGAKPQK